MPPESPRRRLPVGLACGAVLAGLLVLLTRHVALAGADPLDRELTLRLAAVRLPGGVDAARAVTFLGDSRFIYPAALLAALALARRGRSGEAILFAAGVVGAGVSEALLKLAVSRPRPELTEPLVRVSTFSYPSGHAALSVAFFGGLAAAVFLRTENPAARAAAIGGAALAAGAVALTRLDLGVHWATDVAAGILIGAFWVTVLATAAFRRAPRR